MPSRTTITEHGGVMQDLVRDRAEQRASPESVSVRTDDDQVGTPFGSLVDYRGCGLAAGLASVYRNARTTANDRPPTLARTDSAAVLRVSTISCV